VIEWIIAIVYMLLIAAGVLAVSMLPTTADRQQRRAALTDISATPTPPITPDVEAGGHDSPASLFPRAPIRARRPADRNVRPTGPDRGIGSRRGGRRA